MTNQILRSVASLLERFGLGFRQGMVVAETLISPALKLEGRAFARSRRGAWRGEHLADECVGLSVGWAVAALQKLRSLGRPRASVCKRN